MMRKVTINVMIPQQAQILPKIFSKKFVIGAFEFLLFSSDCDIKNKYTSY